MNVLDTSFRLFFAPVLIAQALAVRRQAQRLPEAEGPRSGTLGSGPLLRLGIVGDSSAAGVGVAEQSAALAGQLTQRLSTQFTVTWALNALSGATTKSTLARLEKAQADPRDIIVIALGVNDATRLTSPKRWQRAQDALLARLTTLYQPRLFIISGMPPLGTFPLLPQPLRWTLGRQAQKMEQQRVAWLNTRADCVHLPFVLDPDPELMASDGFHPSATVYGIWAEMIAEAVRAHWSTDQR
ncbi:MAG: SGNH/GDSL hydrolase family protein [Pseudomonadota bacterium]